MVAAAGPWSCSQELAAEETGHQDEPACWAEGKLDPDLPMSPQGVIYHLGCAASQLADKVVLVGDPNRVAVVAASFDNGSIRFRGSHREICIMTGTYKGVPVSCLSTGMGTDNVEIVLNEIHALKEYDNVACRWKSSDERQPGQIHLIRLGTCGCPQPDLELGTFAITRHAIGMDNVGHMYNPGANTPKSVTCLERIINATALGKIKPYAAKAHPDVTNALAAAAQKAGTKYVVGITATGSGFYGCQGRSIGAFRGKLAIPSFVEELRDIRLQDGEVEERVVNVEMESSALCYLSHILGYKAGTLCPIFARRAGNAREFASPELAAESIRAAVPVVLEALISL